MAFALPRLPRHHYPLSLSRHHHRYARHSSIHSLGLILLVIALATLLSITLYSHKPTPPVHGSTGGSTTTSDILTI